MYDLNKWIAPHSPSLAHAVKTLSVSAASHNTPFTPSAKELQSKKLFYIIKNVYSEGIHLTVT
jgi:hypothetical protein